MSTRGHRATNQLGAPGHSANAAVDDAHPKGDAPRPEPVAPRAFGGPGAPQGAGRKRRRRHRSQKEKPRRPFQGGSGHIDIVSRERMFQDIEGLLRQIRERAEEAAVWTDEQLHDFTQSVTGFTKSLEQEGEPLSQRARSEYQRIRDKLSDALRN
jgi:hypothetical protein